MIFLFLYLDFMILFLFGPFPDPSLKIMIFLIVFHDRRIGGCPMTLLSRFILNGPLIIPLGNLTFIDFIGTSPIRTGEMYILIKGTNLLHSIPVIVIGMFIHIGMFLEIRMLIPMRGFLIPANIKAILTIGLLHLLLLRAIILNILLLIILPIKYLLMTIKIALLIFICHINSIIALLGYGVVVVDGFGRQLFYLG